MSYPLEPEEAAAKIVADLLSDLSPERQKAVRDAIYEWASERESAVAGTVMESTWR